MLVLKRTCKVVNSLRLLCGTFSTAITKVTTFLLIYIYGNHLIFMAFDYFVGEQIVTDLKRKENRLFYQCIWDY